MIKVIESPTGVRLMYNDFEVFNHTDILPFVKNVKGRVAYGARKNKLTAKYDCDGEYILGDYRVLSAELKSANISFSGYDGATLTLNVVEERDRLVIYLTPSADIEGIKLNFISSVLEAVFYDGQDIKGKKGNNLIDVAVSAKSLICGLATQFAGKADNALSRLASFNNPLSVKTEKGMTYSFDGTSFADYDLTKKVTATYTFAQCPASLIVHVDTATAKAFADKYNI